MVLNYLLTGMILQVPSRERENISQGQNCRLEKPYAIYFWNCWIYESMKPSHLEKTKVSWFMPFCIIHIYIYIYIYVIGSQKKQNFPELRLSWDLRWVCVVFSLFSPATWSSNNQNRLQRLMQTTATQGSWSYQPTQLHYYKGKSVPSKKSPTDLLLDPWSPRKGRVRVACNLHHCTVLVGLRGLSQSFCQPLRGSHLWSLTSFWETQKNT